jgi:hypothetical protein
MIFPFSLFFFADDQNDGNRGNSLYNLLVAVQYAFGEYLH